MPRSPKFPPTIQQHACGRSRIRWAGQTYWLGRTGSPEATRRYAAICEEIARQGFSSPVPRHPDLTVAELVEWWLNSAPRVYRPESREPKAFRDAIGPLLDLAAAEVVSEIGPRRWAEIRDAMGRKWSRRVANRHWTRIKTMVRRGCEDERIPEVCYARIRTVPALAPGTSGTKDKPKRQAPTDAEVESVLALVPEPVQSALRVAWLSGLRPSEIRLMRAEQLTFDGAVAVYRRTPQDGHKTGWLGRDRVVVLGPQAVALLQPWLPRSGVGYLFRPSAISTREGLNECYSSETFSRAMARAAKRVGLALSPYHLRHSYKVRALAAGGQGVAMSAMGQTSSTAFDTYGGLNIDALKSLAEKIG